MTEIIIDVREYPEFAAGHIQDASPVPLSTVARASQEWDRSSPPIQAIAGEHASSPVCWFDYLPKP